MPEIAGGLAAVRITLRDETGANVGVATLYRAQKITINEKGRKQDTTSTATSAVAAVNDVAIFPSGATTAQAVAGDGLVSVVEADITIEQASYDSTSNLLALPVAINVGSYLRIEIFPNVNTPAVFWDFTFCQVETVDTAIDATALSPITLKAFSKGFYVSPV